jgi:hypothetical protein
MLPQSIRDVMFALDLSHHPLGFTRKDADQHKGTKLR